LSEDEQDEVIEAMLEEDNGEEEEEEEEEEGQEEEEENGENGEGEQDEDPIEAAFAPLTPMAFFRSMMLYTNQGMFSDPLYGGNRDMVGWKLISYPGAQRAYSPNEIQVEGIGLRREPWSMANLPPFNPGQPVEAAINPVTGSDEHDHDNVPNMPEFHQPYQEQLFQRIQQEHQQREELLRGGTPPVPPSPGTPQP
jgi:hypothetical protein